MCGYGVHLTQTHTVSSKLPWFWVRRVLSAESNKQRPCLWGRWTSCLSSSSCSRPQGTQADSFSSLPCSFTALADWHSCLSVCVESCLQPLTVWGERAGRSGSGEMNYSAPAKCQALRWVPHVHLTEKQVIDHDARGILDLQTTLWSQTTKIWIINCATVSSLIKVCLLTGPTAIVYCWVK